MSLQSLIQQKFGRDLSGMPDQSEVHCRVCNCTQILDKILLLWETFLFFFLPLSSRSSLVVSACSAETGKVCKMSSEENLQPFKEKMDGFLTQGELILQIKLN